MTIKTKRLVWTIVFLTITLTAIVMECVAGLLHPAGTIPWTEYLARYVPWPFQLIAYVALATWLPFHFWRHDHLRKAAFRAGVHEGVAATRANLMHFETDPEALAQMFHEAYEEAAPAFGYKTREASAKPWPEVPEQNKMLMIMTAERVIQRVRSGN